MDVDDIDKARALDLAISFVDDHWKSLGEDDITINIFRYLTKLTPLPRFSYKIPLSVVVSVVGCTLWKMFQRHRMVIRSKSS